MTTLYGDYAGDGNNETVLTVNVQPVLTGLVWTVTVGK